MRNKFTLIFLIIIFMGSLYPVYALNQAERSETGKPVSVEAATIDYRVGVGDVLSINVQDNPGFSGNFPVNDKGSIMYFMLGEIKVEGYSLSEIERRIRELLEKDYLYNPIVNISITTYGSRKVEILGGMGKPGTYYISNTTRLFDLFTTAQMIYPKYGDNMKGQMVRILRNRASEDIKAERNIITIDLYELLVNVDEEANVYLQDGDIIYVPSGLDYIYVVGEVKRPGPFPYHQDMTILKAITLAGGPTNAASVNNAFIKRIVNGKEVVEIKVEMVDFLQPDDIVEVPLSFW
ncbi:MAG: polysaccharide biosynthesis/export family protein [Nitrospirae bacterium]|nr:polysaccharide biosynthesis/export family protein [Nitrospirota bacterium]